ncbi:MAG: site-2 protease family protein [Chloroflexi bacterium]|jgi:Zn-dependent protease|nr:site-2 protease family protein [Anaerolineaceae bacterium]NMB88107.1 site-2 protease family protein [Chloroflexota bacterium]
MLGLSPATILTRIITLLIAFTIHEFSHAWVATSFGDDTPRANGRLTLNPASHLDLMGTLMLLFAGFGWARPVPVNPYALQRRSPSALMWVSLAGPFSNFLLAVVAAMPLRLGLVRYTFSTGLFPSLFEFLIEFIFINLTLALFNLIPLAPLDGEKIAEYFFPPSWARVMETIRPYGPLILISILFVGPLIGLDLFGWVISPAVTGLTRLLLGGAL